MKVFKFKNFDKKKKSKTVLEDWTVMTAMLLLVRAEAGAITLFD